MTSKQDSSKRFLELSADKCLETFPIMFQNADNHFHSAKILAENKLYGNAVAHLVLSTEERIKGLIIFLDGLGCNIRQVPGIINYFERHQKRLNLACFIIIFNDKLTSIISIQIEMMQKFPNGNIPEDVLAEKEN